MRNFNEYYNLLMENKSKTDAIFAEDHKHTDDNEGCGFAIDGPINPNVWDELDYRILFLLKETFDMDGCDSCIIMGMPEKFNDSKTNLNISKLSHFLIKTLSKEFDISRSDFYKLDDSTLMEAYSKIAIVEVKKTSGINESDDSVIREHSRLNKEFIAKQIELLNPSIIICGGMVTWHSLTEDTGLFDREKFSLTDERKAFKCKEKIIVNSYHPSYTKFNIPKIINEIATLSYL